jgi:hypothetical protein
MVNEMPDRPPGVLQVQDTAVSRPSRQGVPKNRLLSLALPTTRS